MQYRRLINTVAALGLLGSTLNALSLEEFDKKYYGTPEKRAATEKMIKEDNEEQAKKAKENAAYTAYMEKYNTQSEPLLSKKELVLRSLDEMVRIEDTKVFAYGKFLDKTGKVLRPGVNIKLSPFYISKYPVYGTEFRSYLDQTGGVNRYIDEHSSYPLFVKPYANKTEVRQGYSEAEDYCSHLAKTSGLPFSLPTEYQWEYACKDGDENKMFPTQNGKIEPGVNFPDSESIKKEYDGFYPYFLHVDDKPVNRFGLHRMVSTAWGSEYVKGYYPGSLQEDTNRREVNSDPQANKTVNSDTFNRIEKGSVRVGCSDTSAAKSNDKAGFRCVINSTKPMEELKKEALEYLKEHQSIIEKVKELL